MPRLETNEIDPSAATTGRVARFQRVTRVLWQAIGQVAERAPLRFALFAVLVLQVLTVFAFRPSYATNDDVFITMIASGKGLCPAPDEHLIFTNVIIGTALKQLYTAFPGVPWYGCYLLLVHYAAQVALLYCALTIGRRSSQADRLPGQIDLRCGLYLLYFGLVELPLLNRFQFTTTAFLAAQAGIFLWLLAWQRCTSQKDATIIGPLCAAIVLMFVGGIIRLESLEMAVLVAIPVAILFLNKSWRQPILSCGIAMAAAAALVVAAVSYDHWVYEQDPSWRGFRELNQIRGKFHDVRWTSYTPETAPIFSKVGWSENDHAMIANWFSDDPVLYSRENLSTIVDAYPWSSARRTAEVWWQAFRTIAQNRAVMSLLLVLPFVLTQVRVRSAQWAIVGSVLAALALLGLVTWSQKVPPERVYLPLLSFPLSVALLSFAWPNEKTSPGRAWTSTEGKGKFRWLPISWQGRSLQTQVVVGLLVVAIVIGVDRQVRQSVRVGRSRVALESFLADARAANQKLYVSWEAALPYELSSPFDNLSSWSGIRLLSLAWSQRTPWAEEIKRQFGITNLARALCERYDIVLVSTPLHRSLFTTFAREHFNADIAFVPSRQISDSFVAGSFERQATPGNTADRRTDAAQR
jgi:hypothetical protein